MILFLQAEDGIRDYDVTEVQTCALPIYGDDPGEAAAREAAIRSKYEGRSVRIARPPRGSDFNDLLLGRRPLLEADAA